MVRFRLTKAKHDIKLGVHSCERIWFALHSDARIVIVVCAGNAFEELRAPNQLHLALEQVLDLFVFEMTDIGQLLEHDLLVDSVILAHRQGLAGAHECTPRPPRR